MKRFIAWILLVLVVGVLPLQAMPPYSRSVTLLTDCSNVTANGMGCYDLDDHTYCMGNGTRCNSAIPPVGANFSTQATLGTEAVTWSAAGWNEDGATWTFSGGVLTHVTGNTTAVTSTLVAAPIAGTTYKVTITGTGGGATATYTLGGVTGTTIAASGVIAITDYITASTTGELIITPANTCTVAITNISVKALTDATGDLTVEGNIYARSQILAQDYFPATTAAYPVYSFESYPTYGLGMFGATSLGLYFAGSPIHYYTNAAYSILSDTASLQLGASQDVKLYRDAAANVLSLRNTATQQTLRIYNTADAHPTITNYERLSITGLAGNSGNATMETAGTGADNLHLVLSGAGTGSVKLRGPSWSRTTTKTVSSTPVTLTTEEICNANVFVTTGASVINLPAGAATLDGCVSRFTAIAAVAFSVDPNGSEVMVLSGAALTGGNKVTTDGAVDTQFSVAYDTTASRWRVVGVSGVLSDGGA